MTENEVARIVVDAAVKVHRNLGPGLLEAVYVSVLEYELYQRGLSTLKQQLVSIRYEDLDLPSAFRADLIVEDKIIVEVKSLERLAPVHSKQLLTYLKLTDMRLGLLLNFGEALMKDGIVRLVNGLNEDSPSRLCANLKS